MAVDYMQIELKRCCIAGFSVSAVIDDVVD